MRDPSWSSDGKRLAVVVLDRIWTMQPDGREGSELTKAAGVEREPAWSWMGNTSCMRPIAEMVSIYVVNAPGAQTAITSGAPERVAMLEGDERWPSWTPDGRIVFANRATDTTQWDLFADRSGCGDGQADPAPAHANIG